jgi:glyoxylase I family protein
MRFEHFAINVPDACNHGQWLVDHLGFTVLRSMAEAPYTRFLADDTGRVVVELYSNPDARCLDFKNQGPLEFHFALVSTDAVADQTRLEAAGATLVEAQVLADGSQLTMLRDPWGVALQLCQRARPF